MSPTWKITLLSPDNEDTVLFVEDATVEVVGGALHIKHRRLHVDGGRRTVERYIAAGTWLEAWTEYP
jgi:hypothetical protein